MAKQYPKRPETHILEDLSARHLSSSLPDSWSSYKPQGDYGIDSRIIIFHEGMDTGLEFLVQLKSAKEGTGKEYETVVLKTSTYNMMDGKLQVVLLVKYIRSENKSYYMLLKNAPEPDLSKKQCTIRIPRINILDGEGWEIIKNYVYNVQGIKLASMAKPHHPA